MQEDEINPEEILKRAVKDLDDSKFKFCCFCDNFKRFIEKKYGA